MGDLSAVSAKPRLRLLLDHFSKIKDTRQVWKVAYPLREVLFLVVCGTIASDDDYEDIVDWGKASVVPAGLCRVPLRHSLRRLAAHGDESDQPGPVHGLLFIMGRAMLAGQARSRGDRRQDLAPQPQSQDRRQGPSKIQRDPPFR